MDSHYWFALIPSSNSLHLCLITLLYPLLSLKFPYPDVSPVLPLSIWLPCWKKQLPLYCLLFLVSEKILWPMWGGCDSVVFQSLPPR